MSIWKTEADERREIEEREEYEEARLFCQICGFVEINPRHHPQKKDGRFYPRHHQFIGLPERDE